MFRDSKIDIRGEWVVIIEANHTIQRYLIADDIIKMDIPPKVKSKLLSKITDQSTKEWYIRIKHKFNIKYQYKIQFIFDKIAL